MLKRSGQVALCGMIAAVCILLMLMTGLFPFATYALPAVAGLLMVAVVVECGVKWAVMVYVAVSLLAIFITPDREAMLMFVFFFGHYPIIKAGLERIRLRPLEWLVKFGVFNACVLAAYARDYLSLSNAGYSHRNGGLWTVLRPGTAPDGQCGVLHLRYRPFPAD